MLPLLQLPSHSPKQDGGALVTGDEKVFSAGLSYIHGSTCFLQKEKGHMHETMAVDTREDIRTVQHFRVEVKPLPDTPFHRSIFRSPVLLPGPSLLDVPQRACHACDRISAKGSRLEDPTNVGPCHFCA